MSAEAREDCLPFVRIGQRLVGDKQRVLVIAEAGVNHNGSRGEALRLVDVAADAGADVVKFQVFRASELVTRHAATAAYQQQAGASSQRALLQALELTASDFREIAQRCRQRGLLFLATPFGPADVDLLLELEVEAIKIASTDVNNVILLRRVVATGLPLIVSTGAAREDEIAVAVARLKEWGAWQRLILLHCVSSYPAPLECANLRAIASLRKCAGVPVGFSDHTDSTVIAGLAVAAGACVLEKHFTRDRAARGPDHAMSLDPQGLAAYVRSARAAEVALGDGRLGMTAIEEDVRHAARKSLVAAQHIAAGTVVTADMLTVKRPGGGVSPEALDDLVGRSAVVDIAVDTTLTWEMVQ